MNKTVTAEEYLHSYYEKGEYQIHIDDAVENMIGFAKLHVQAALEAANKKSRVILKEDGEIKKVKSRKVDIEYLSEVSGDFSFRIDKDSILNAYPLENIK